MSDRPVEPNIDYRKVIKFEATYQLLDEYKAILIVLAGTGVCWPIIVCMYEESLQNYVSGGETKMPVQMLEIAAKEHLFQSKFFPNGNPVILDANRKKLYPK